MNACQPTSFSQETFGYGSHAIIVLNATRRRHVNKQGNENNECEIPTVTLKLLIRIKTTKYTSIREYKPKSEVLFLYQGIFHYFNPSKWFECDRGNFTFVVLVSLFIHMTTPSTVLAWLPYPGATE